MGVKFLVFFINPRIYICVCVCSYYFSVVRGGMVVMVLAIGPKVHEYIPDRGRWIFKADKNP
jgi:hypothetical protein